jgi:transketolase
MENKKKNLNIKSLRQEFADTLLEVGRKDKRLTVMVGDISHGLLKKFNEICKKQYINLGILEPTMVSMGAGFSRIGLIPVLHTISPFLIERSFEQIKLDFCYQKLSGNIITVGGAFDYSNLGCSHHCYGDFALLKTLPSVDIYNPSSAVEFNEIFKKTYNNNRVNYFRLSGNSHSLLFNRNQIIPGKPIKINNGKHITIVAVGSQLNNALIIVDKFLKLKINSDLFYIHSIKPFFSKDIIESAKKTKKVFVIEEHMENGGFGDDVLKKIYNVDKLIFKNFAINKFIHSYGTYEELCNEIGLNPHKIFNQIKKII